MNIYLLFWGFSKRIGTEFVEVMNEQSPQLAHCPSHFQRVKAHVSVGLLEEP